jgi:pimeloyl-ACP methyl ester carboxylesterase
MDAGFERSGAAGATTAFVRLDGRDSLRLAYLPTLVLASRSDGCFRSEEYEPQRGRFTGGYAFEVIEGGGHFLHREQPASVMSALLAFLEATRP